LDAAVDLKQEPLILTEGSVVERLQRTPGLALDPHIANAALLFDPRGSRAMEAVYRAYLDVAQRADRRILVAGLMGCRGDAYRPDQALSEDRAFAHHEPQARALARAGADLLMAATLPALCEALGLARAMASCGVPYVVSFVLGREGLLLDGTALDKAMAAVDEHAEPRALGFMINCVHPARLLALLEQDRAPLARGRLLGLQGNASLKSPDELDGLDHLDAGDPEAFGEAMAALHQRFGLKVLGGCCGTDERHMEAVARLSRP